MTVKGQGVINRIHDAYLADTAPTSIIFNLRQQNASDPAPRFRPNNVEPSCPCASVGSEDGESQDLSFFIYSNIVTTPPIKVAVEMGAAVIRVHNIFHVLEDDVFH